jgi:hypothetical protein
MRYRIEIAQQRVLNPADDLALKRDDSADRHLARFLRKASLGQRGLRHWLLLRHARQGTQPPYRINTVDADDLATRKRLRIGRQDVQSFKLQNQ